MHSRFISLFAVLAIAVGLTGCDAWPTHAVNHAALPISFQWHHKDYAQWSAPLTLEPGQTQWLARAHYVEDFTGLRIKEGDKIYTFIGPEMEKLRRICVRSMLDHLDSLGDCDLTYLGNGHVAVRRVQ